MADRNKTLLDCIRGSQYVTVQNALMRVSDQNLALALYYLHEEDRAFVLSFVAAAKMDRVETALTRLEQVKVKDEYCSRAVDLIIGRIRGDAGADQQTGYYRPRKRP